MDKNDVSTILENIGALLELTGENPFKVRAYQNGARILSTMSEDLQTLVAEKRLTEIKGIGEALAEKITTLVTTGSLPYYEDLQKKVPEGILSLTKIQGLGPKRAMILAKKLKVTDLPSLEKAARDGKIAKLKGFGPGVQENILKGISFATEHASEHLAADAEPVAEEIMAALKKSKGLLRIAACGSLRRRKETVHDVDILASCGKNTEPIMKTFVGLPGVSRVLGQGETKSSVIYGPKGVQVDLRLVADKEFPFAQHYFTGNKEHNIAMRQRAIDRGLKLNEYGLFRKDEKPVACKTEEDVFKTLGLHFIPPELREDRGEIERAEKGPLPPLVEPKDLRGVFHMHSTWSDGTKELEEMIHEAERMGFEYVGISDHSQAATYAHGLSEERVRQQFKAIESFRKKFKIHIFWGTECDILKDGTMDYPDAVLANFDFVIASVHSSFTLPEQEMTARIVRALKNKYVTFLGHPTGRLLLQRQPYAVNLDDVFKAAAGEGVALEINAQAKRMELDWRQIPKARELGCEFSCHPDAHSFADLHGFARAVWVARKGGLGPDAIVNTLPLKKITAWLDRR